VQTTIYFSDKDAYLLAEVAKFSRHERRSRSAVIADILEQHFEGKKVVGEILVDQGLVQVSDLTACLGKQREQLVHDLLGKILVSEGLVTTEQVDRALMIQGRAQSELVRAAS